MVERRAEGHFLPGFFRRHGAGGKADRSARYLRARRIEAVEIAGDAALVRRVAGARRDVGLCEHGHRDLAEAGDRLGDLRAEIIERVAAAARTLVDIGIILGIIMVIRDRGLLNMVFWGGVGRSISAGGFSMLAGYLAVSSLPLGAEDRGIVTLGSKLAVIGITTLTVHIAISGLFGLEEARPVFNWIKRILLRPIRGAY